MVSAHGADNSGRNLLHRAAKSSNIDFVKEWLLEGANPSPRDRAGRTPLHYAALTDYYPVVELLVGKMPDLEVRDDKNMTAFDYAFRRLMDLCNNEFSVDDQRFIQICFRLISSRLANGREISEVHARDSLYNKTYLIRAAENNEEDTTRFFIKCGIDPNAKDIYGNHAMHYAVNGASRVEIFIMLLEGGANVNYTTNGGHIALDHALNFGKDDDCTLLRVKGGKTGLELGSRK